MEVDRDCSTCIHHKQAQPVNDRCMECLMATTCDLPLWAPEGGVVVTQPWSLAEYLKATEERHRRNYP